MAQNTEHIPIDSGPPPRGDRSNGAGRSDPEASRAEVADRVRAIRRAVRKARSRVRRLLILRPVAWGVCAVIGALGAIAALDAWQRLSTGMRTLLLVALLVATAYALLRIVRSALRTRIGRTDLASRIERVLEARGHGVVPGLLATGLQFAKQAPDEDTLTESFRLGTLRSLAQTYSPEIIRDAVNPYPTRRAIGAAAGLVAVVVVASLLAPQTSTLIAQRVLTPWSAATWPVRFPVDDLTGVRVHASDTALLVRAETVARARAVRLEYRVLVPTDPSAAPEDATFVSLSETLSERMLIQESRDGRAIYETLLDPTRWRAPGAASRAAGAPALTDGTVMLEYRLVTADASTAFTRVTVTPPPRVESAALRLALPSYASGTPAAFARGDVIDGRPLSEIELVDPVLAGTEVTLSLTYSKPVAGWDGWSAALLGGPDVGDASAPLSDTIAIRGVIERTGEVRLAATDRFGIPDRRPPALRVEVEPDRPSQPAVIAPARDEAVLATAVVDILGEARDDVGLGSLGLTAQRFAPRADSPGAPPEPVGAEAEIASAPLTLDAALNARASAALSPADFDAQPGDAIVLHAVSTDRRPGRPEASRSAPRRLLVISEREFVDQIRRELGGVRNAARSLDEEQGRVRTRTAEAAGDAADASAEMDAGPGPDLEPGEGERAVSDAAEDLSRASASQDALTQRLTGQRRRLDELAQRVGSNRLEDSALTELLDAAREAVTDAEDASQRAAEQAQRAAEATEGGDDRARDDSARRADDEQREVRDQLGRLMERLDQGEDAWMARRSIERLLDEQRSLTEQTQRLGEQTLGRSTEELTEDERSELDRIAERQREIAREAEAALDDLDDRARELEDADRAQADALATAARRARQGALSEQLERAAEEVGQNQTGQAGQTQQEATETLEEVLDELDSVESRRAEQLRRQLADVAAAIDTLIRAQTREIGALDGLGPADTPALRARADAMIALNRNTIATIDQAAAELQNAASVVTDPLEAASDAQSSAIVGLRAQTAAGLARAVRDEQDSLASLEEALAAAEGLLEQAEEEERRQAVEALLSEYRAASERQRELRDGTAGYTGRRLSRRERADLRGVGAQQRELGETVSDLGERVGEFSRLGMLEFTHELLDASIGRAADELGRGRASDAVVDDQSQASELLDSIVTALSPDPDARSPFNPAGGAGQEGQQQGGAQGEGEEPPPTLDLAELMLLRSVQERAARLTREASETGAEPPAALQRRLADLIVEMLERLQDDQPGAPVGPPGDGAEPEPGPEPGPEAGPEAGPEPGTEGPTP